MRMKKEKILHKLEVQVIIALILGILWWLYIPFIENIFWMWEFFMRLLKVFLAPLLFFSVFVAILGLWDFRRLWNIWVRTLWYYALTTTLAITISLLLMNILTPGEWLKIWIEEWFNAAQVEWITFAWFMKDLIPWNIVTAFVNLNAMQIVVSGIILWVALIATGKEKKVENIKNIVDTLNAWILKFIELVIKITPIWVFAIVAKVVSENGISSMINLLPFVYVILLALFIHAVITLPTIWYFIWKFNPYKYFLKVKQAILVGFSTSSSSATMWLSMSVARNNAHLSKEVVDFTFPIWTTINMDWTAIYQAWVALFIAQVLWVDISIAGQLTIVIIVILASIWAAGIPWAWILILTTVFLTIWLPVEAIWIILAVDRILDMFRTWVNVWWDLLTAKVVDRFYVKKLDKLIKQQDKQQKSIN